MRTIVFLYIIVNCLSSCNNSSKPNLLQERIDELNIPKGINSIFVFGSGVCRNCTNLYFDYYAKIKPPNSIVVVDTFMHPNDNKIKNIICENEELLSRIIIDSVSTQRKIELSNEGKIISVKNISMNNYKLIIR